MRLPWRDTGGGPRRPRRVQQAIYASTKRLEGHTTALGLAVAAVGLLLAWLAWSSVNGVPLQDRYELKAIVPAGAPIVAEGDTVRVAGRLAGLVTEVEPARRGRRVTMELRPKFAPVGRDASVKVRVKSLVYLTYVELNPGNARAQPMGEGATIPLERASSNVDLLEVVELFDRRSREALKKAIYNSGIGLATRGDELNTSLGDLPPLTRNTRRQLEAVTSTRGAIARSIAGAGRVSRGLRGERGDDVGALLGAGDATFATIAGRTPELARTIDLLRPVEDELIATAPLANPLLDDAARLSTALLPALGSLERTLPHVNSVLARGDVLRRETDRLTGLLRPVLREATPVVAGLETTVATITPLLVALERLKSALGPYEDDITTAAKQVISATSVRYAEGQTAPGNVVLRFAPIFSCHPWRNPYPKPGVAQRQARPC